MLCRLDRFEDIRETLDYLKMFTRFPFALRRFLDHTLTMDEARSAIRERMEQREPNFLRVVERSIYGNPRSPYLSLLKMAGCELGDLRALVAQKGLEGALSELREEGVYVTFEEFRGRKPIVRNGKTIPVKPRDFDNPSARRDLTMETGGTSGLALSVNQDLDYIAAGAVYHLLMLDSYDLIGAPSAMWASTFPGSAFRGILQRACIGQNPERWFMPTGWRDSKYWLKYDLATWYMIAWLRVCRFPIPLPELVKPAQALVVARWIRETVKTYGRCILYTNASLGVRVCLAAEKAGLDLTGAVIRAGGEPVTPAKRDVMLRVGARYIAGYTMTEAAPLAVSCARPADSNDTHLLTDIYALITHPFLVEGIGVTVPAFNLTGMLPSAPKVLLNYQVDDYGIVEERHCGCKFDAYGYTTHIRQVRSYTKLVGEGVTLIGNEIQRILEEVLPARFGGSVLDYQLMEEEDAQGFTRLYLLISPRVGSVDEDQVVQVVLSALRESSPMADAARTVWQHARTIQIKRQEPFSNARGKVLPLHIRRNALIS